LRSAAISSPNARVWVGRARPHVGGEAVRLKRLAFEPLPFARPHRQAASAHMTLVVRMAMVTIIE